MKITLFGATGGLGRQCLLQCLEVGHEVTVLVRDPQKLPDSVRNRLTIVQGDALVAGDVLEAVSDGTDAILFAIGVDEKTSPQNLCTDATKNIIDAMRQYDISKLVWCGGGSNILSDDVITWGSKFVRWYAEVFLKHRHSDKENQLRLLENTFDLDWIGIRPLQMNEGKRTEKYRLGFNAYSGLSKISFSDCAHAMLHMLADDTWTRKAPIIQY
ncbi:NAD-dependent epimerase/dehydratase family protein [Halieaceae bacterium IMCC14734]|uniref:NAD-dependent epimerase/dehydratase family protein n=1 Tax=Candidatus Litorirhabdus singularis TaxID=2518993 RepID=A0ABT3TGG4_9GAMM|nr:NAD(P)H-binding protein [Candidatus Litorirhabdus singularis]MCX2981402.1 NAD-dependent epimerase/dehydratase family protein [Candidatus Litorirhabdus singularis]